MVWEEGFKGIKYANIAISRLDAAKYKTKQNERPYWAPLISNVPIVITN